MTLEDHKCSLGFGSNSMLRKSAHPGLCEKLCHGVKKSFQVSEHHPKCYLYFRSYPAVLAERLKHLIESGMLIIHPLSLFSLYWRTFMIAIHLAKMIIAPIRLCFIITPMDPPLVHPLDHILFLTHIITFLNVIINLNTGLTKHSKRQIVLPRSRIVCGYLQGLFLPDLISCFPVSYILLHLQFEHQARCLLVAHMLPLLSALRLWTVLDDLRTIFLKFNISLVWRSIVQHVMLLLLCINWFSSLMFFIPISYYYWYGVLPTEYCRFLHKSIESTTFKERYLGASFIVVAAFFGSTLSLYYVDQFDEILIASIVILCLTAFMVYTIVVMLKVYLTKFSSSMRYHEVMNETENYMHHKQFSAALKKRVRMFYDYRYQELYFKEDNALESLSEHLRNEITLHTCHNLLNNVALFEGVSASLVGTLLGCLRCEVFLQHDLVVRGGDIGDCMYFIANGTVAVYSLKGAEVCHLGDGSYFGEVALLMKDRKRVASVIAIETTQVFRLDGADFRRYVISDHVLYERIEEVASQRMHETILLDEAYRRQRDAPAPAGQTASFEDQESEGYTH